MLYPSYVCKPDNDGSSVDCTHSHLNVCRIKKRRKIYKSTTTLMFSFFFIFQSCTLTYLLLHSDAISVHMHIYSGSFVIHRSVVFLVLFTNELPLQSLSRVMEIKSLFKFVLLFIIIIILIIIVIIIIEMMW